jgi:transposase
LTYGEQRDEVRVPSAILNPIELAFSAMKHHLRRNGSYNRMAMTEMSDEDIHITLLKALYIISPQDIYGWYRHCGYI